MDNKFAYWKANSLWHDMASTYHSFDRYRSTTNSYIEKQTAYGMIWLRHIIGLIHIDKIIGEVLERQHGIILIPEYLSVGWQVSIGEVHILLKSTTPIDNTHAIPIEIPIGYQWGIIPGVINRTKGDINVPGTHTNIFFWFSVWWDIRTSSFFHSGVLFTRE